MADQMFVIITLTKPIPDRDTGRVLFDFVKDKVSDFSEVKVSGHITNHFSLDDTPEPT